MLIWSWITFGFVHKIFWFSFVKQLMWRSTMVGLRPYGRSMRRYLTILVLILPYSLFLQHRLFPPFLGISQARTKQTWIRRVRLIEVSFFFFGVRFWVKSLKMNLRCSLDMLSKFRMMNFLHGVHSKKTTTAADVLCWIYIQEKKKWKL